MRNLMILSLLGLAACGLNEEQFTSDYADMYCTEYDSCNTSGDPCPISTDTTSDTDSADDSTCDFDKAKAKECLDAAWTCDDAQGAGLEVVVPDASCSQVCGTAAAAE